MSETEDRLARELGFRVTEKGFIDTHFRGENRNLALWRKCLELTEQRGGTAKEWLKANLERFVTATSHNGLAENTEWIDLEGMLEAYASSRLAQQQERGTQVAMNAWQVLGALWGISKDAEQCRIMNWFWDAAHGTFDKELFPFDLQKED